MKSKFQPKMQLVPQAKQQKGAVLLVALVLLLIMTLMGVSGMQGAKLQTKMAGNFQDQEIAFQMAELALREAEVWLDGLTEEPLATATVPTLPALGDTTGQVWLDESLDDSVIASGGWVDPNIGSTFWGSQKESEMANSSIGKGSSTGGYIWERPKYVVSFAGISKVNQSAAEGYGSQDKKIRLYRVTAFGVGGRDNTQITLQSVFTREFQQ